MTAYNKVNGKYTCEDRELTEDILRDEWGFKGTGDIRLECRKRCRDLHRSGNDMLQPGQDRQYKAILSRREWYTGFGTPRPQREACAGFVVKAIPCRLRVSQ